MNQPLSDVDASVRRAVYAVLGTTGAAPSPHALADSLGLDVQTVQAALRRLDAAHHLVLGAGGDAVRMAHPFSAAPMAFVVRSRTDDRLWWGGCAWDSFGIAAALGEELTAETRCPGCGAELRLSVGPGASVPEPYSVVVPLPAAHWWDDVVWTCTRIRLCCDAAHARGFIDTHGLDQAQLVPAATMHELSTTWYGDRLDPAYTPQTSAQRQEQLTAVGLTGPFWRLPGA